MIKQLRKTGATLAALSLFLSPVWAQPDPNKVLRVSFPVAETGFDPAKVHDVYSSEVLDNIFETLLTYDYLARPVKVVPGVAEAMPVVADEGKTYTYKLRKGVYFSDDPAFGGKKRELVADDVIYSTKRHMDMNNRPVWKFLFDGKIIGLNELADEQKKSNGKFNYDTKVAGLVALDKYTVQFKLKEPDYNFNYIMAQASTAIVAREVIEAAGDNTNARPVGTGPYVLSKWARGSSIELTASPSYRGKIWDSKSTAPEDQEIIKHMTGKRMPLVGKIDIRIILEDNPALLAFQAGELDYWNLRPSVADRIMNVDKLKPEFVKQGIRLQRFTEPEITYNHILWEDPVWGGPAKERIALRKAAFMAWDVDDQIKIVRKGQAVKAHYMAPPGVIGHDPNYRSPIKYDIDGANKLLDRFGYKVGADGWRTQPNGQPLSLKYTQDPTDLGRSYAELWDKGLKKIKIKMDFTPMPFAEALKKEKDCKLASHGSAWIADYPDGDNFFMLMYGPNKRESNNPCFDLPEYNKLYEQSRRLPDGPARNKLFADMQKLIDIYVPIHLHDTRIRNMLTRKQAIYKKHPVMMGHYLYVDLVK
jgi:oligopeptide transport system substrate-binding protein